MLYEASCHIVHFSFKDVNVMFLRNMCHRLLVDFSIVIQMPVDFASACHPSAS